MVGWMLVLVLVLVGGLEAVLVDKVAVGILGVGGVLLGVAVVGGPHSSPFSASSSTTSFASSASSTSSASTTSSASAASYPSSWAMSSKASCAWLVAFISSARVNGVAIFVEVNAIIKGRDVFSVVD